MRRLLTSAAIFVTGMAVGTLGLMRYQAGWPTRIVWGDVGTWVGGLGTAIAVAVAALQITASRRAEERAEERLRRALAMAVTITGLEAHAAPSGTVLRAMVENGGSLPVFEAQVHLTFPDDQTQKVRIGTLGVSGTKSFELPVSKWLRPEDVQWELRFRDSHGSVWRSIAGAVELIR